MEESEQQGKPVSLHHLYVHVHVFVHACVHYTIPVTYTGESLCSIGPRGAPVTAVCLVCLHKHCFHMKGQGWFHYPGLACYGWLYVLAIAEQLSIHGADDGQLARKSCPLSAVCLPISPLSAFHFLENRDLFHLNMTDEESNLLVKQRRNGCSKYRMCR